MYVLLNLDLHIKSYEPKKICLILENRGKHPLKVIKSQQKSHQHIQLIREPYSRSFKLLSTKIWNFYFLPQDRSRMRVYLFVFCFFVFCLFVFFPGVIVSIQWSKNVLSELILTEIKTSSAIFKWPKNWRASRPPPTLMFFPKSSDQNYEIVILFEAVPNTFVFGTRYSPTAPWEGPQVTNFDRCLHIVMVIWKRTDAFKEIFWFGGGVEWRGLCGGNFPWGILHWRRKFPWRGPGFLSIFLKNNEKINMKKFFQLKVRSSIKT